MKMAKRHQCPVVNQEVEPSREFERLNFENVLLCMVVIEIVAAVNHVSHQIKWDNSNISEKKSRPTITHKMPLEFHRA